MYKPVVYWLKCFYVLGLVISNLVNKAPVLKIPIGKSKRDEKVSFKKHFARFDFLS